VNKNINQHFNKPKEENKPKENKRSTIEYESNSLLGKLDKIKGEGNDFFRSGKYAEACDKYYEVLNEISYLSEKDTKQYIKELEELEILCRLNIANVKLKSDDYDFVIRECAKVLKKNENNFKANYRSGVGYFKKGNYSKAESHFNRAREINKNEESDQSIY
jgi:tetratricopeptide (TPR) repeat protein